MDVLISIITPCYNKGEYLDDAIESIAVIKTPYAYEHIIVNDGSTDIVTTKKLDELDAKGYKIIHQENMGPAAARNTAFAKAKGKYILPLDADNKLLAPYLTTAIDVLEHQEEIDVVFGNSHFFGNENFYNKVKQFDIYQMLKCNYIDTCAVIRKSILDETKGYDTEISWGHEDWELWLNIFFKGGKFYYLDELCFYYRVTDNSLRLKVSPKETKDKEYIIKKNSGALLNFFLDNYWRIEYLKQQKIKGSLNILLGKVF